MMVSWRSFIRRVRPSVCSDPAKRFCQYEYEMTTTGAPPARSTSSGRGKRPRAGVRPSAEK
jgi:hypothetical protein